MIHFVHILDKPNTGDRVSGPYWYFDFPEHRVFDLMDRHDGASVVVYGGGALGNWFHGRQPYQYPKDARAVLWGVGTSRHGQLEPPPFDTDRFALIGLREYGLSDIWAPCASCMSDLFDRDYEITREAVRFDNADPSIQARYPMACDLPVMDNTASFDEIVAFLGSAEVVVTHSYHACFWALLLGRKVVCAPYSSKFHWFKHPPAYSSQGGLDWREKAREAQVYPEALAECREASRAFYERVMEELG